MRAAGIGAHPVVEIEEHRRALRRSFEQVAELAKDVGTYGIAIVLGQQEPVAAFPRVDVEMVEPEIGEHLLQLALAIHRAKQLLLRQLEDDSIGLLLHGAQGVRRLTIFFACLGLLLTAFAPRFELR